MSLLGDLGTAIKNKLGGTSVDNTVPIYNGTTCTLQGSSVTISDTNVVTASGGFVGSLTGNASTATKLQTARTINGVAFDGTANITVSDSTAVKLTDNQTIAGVKTFSSSPIVPTPTIGTQVANKDYADTKASKVNPVFTGNGITIPVLASDPSGAVAGQMYYNSTDKAVKNFDGTSWTLMANKFSATGGTVTEVNGYRIHTFTSSGTFTALSSGTVEYLIIGGGGGGGSRGGGGGAGGFIAGITSLIPSNYSILIGAGGAASSDSATGGTAYSGSNSSALYLTASGGGAGGLFQSVGISGASGGGAGRDSSSTLGGSGIYGQGYAGGSGYGASCAPGGGGGGAGGPGYAGISYGSGLERGGMGGLAKSSSITGQNIYYCGGGGGASGCSSPDAASYGLGGGTSTILLKGGAGNGGVTSIPRQSTAGSANTGGGGGGGGDQNSSGYLGTNYAGAPGGSGIVIIRYPL